MFEGVLEIRKGKIMVHDRILKAISTKKFVTPMYIANRLNVEIDLTREICFNLFADGLLEKSKNNWFKRI